MIRLTRVLAAFLISCTSYALEAATFKFTYTADQYGVLGSFTMNDIDLFREINQPYTGYVSNAFISKLNFNFQALAWSSSDIATSDYTIFSVTGALPEVVGGSGSLAQLVSIPGRSGAITIFNPLSGTEFGTAGYPVPGHWSTSVVSVPEPASSLLLVSGLALVGAAVSRRKMCHGT